MDGNFLFSGVEEVWLDIPGFEGRQMIDSDILDSLLQYAWK